MTKTGRTTFTNTVSTAIAGKRSILPGQLLCRGRGLRASATAASCIGGDLFGGYQKKSGDYYRDLYSFDLSKKKWEQLELVGETPKERTDHSCVLYDGAMYVFGGYDGRSRFGDLYKCSL